MHTLIIFILLLLVGPRVAFADLKCTLRKNQSSKAVLPDNLHFHQSLQNLQAAPSPALILVQLWEATE